MSIGYRSILQLDKGTDALRVAEEQLHDWLRGKLRGRTRALERADWEGPGVHDLGPGAQLTVLENTSQDGRLRRALLEYVEGNDQGVWTTRVYAMSNPDARRYRQTLWFESEGIDTQGRSLPPSPPRIVRNTLETTPAFDGAVPVLPEPSMVRGDDTEDLLTLVTDPERSLSLVIASPVPGVGDEVWRRAVDSITKETMGAASFFVLDGPAHQLLNEQLGPAHALPLGALRTFVPGVELEDPLDARRHRVLTTATVNKGLVKTPPKGRTPGRLVFDERTKRLVSVSPRRQLLEKELPSDLSRATRLLQRQRLVITEEQLIPATPVTDQVGPERREQVETPLDSPRTEVPVLEPAPTPAPEPAPTSASSEQPAEENSPTLVPAPEPRAPWLGRLTALVRRVVGRETVDEQALRALTERFERQERAIHSASRVAESLQSEKESLEDQVSELKNQLEAEQFERGVAEAERQQAERKTRQLEAWRATREDHYEFVEEAAPLWESDPVSVMDVVERLTDEDGFDEIRRYVSFTDIERAIDDAAEVDVIDKSSLYASSFWEYVLVLRDFAKEVDEYGFSGNVHTYLGAGDRVVGRKCPQARHRSNESESVSNNRKWRKERTFKVPTSVHPEGQMFMTTHFAPTNRDQNAPRMYYALGKKDGLTHAYIGYIGRHLTNTKTS